MSYIKAAEYIMSKIELRPRVAVVLGTGMGELAERLQSASVIPYAEIPGFPEIGGNWHRCRAVIGTFDGIPVIFMQGRLHYYEGYSMQEVVFPVHMLRAMGAETLILTNAAGAVNSGYRPGELALIRDHIKLGLESPMRGRNNDALGERFFDMTHAYDPGLCSIAVRAAEDEKITLHEGVYAYMAGPQFETPAEIRMLRLMGADLVGMSTVPEVIAAVHCGMRVMAVSGITNMAAGIDGSVDQKEIDRAGAVLLDKTERLLSGILRRI